jgi:hypothetical protein
MYVKLSWRPEVDHNWAIMVVQPTILTYPTMVFYFWLATQVLWNDLRWIVIKKRHWQTFLVYLCVHPLPVRMAARITKYLNKYMRTGLCLIYMSSFYFWSPPLARKRRQPTGPMEWFTGNSYQTEALTNVFRFHTCRSSHPEDRKLPITELKWDARTPE